MSAGIYYLLKLVQKLCGPTLEEPASDTFVYNKKDSD